MTDKPSKTETPVTPPEPKPTTLPIVSGLSEVHPVLPPKLGRASIDLYAPVIGENGETLGTTRVIVSQESSTAGEALELLMGQMEKYIGLGFSPLSPNQPRMTPAPTGVPSAPGMPTAPGFPGAPVSPGVPGGSPTPAQPVEESGTWAIDRIVVTPLPEGNVKVEFYRLGQDRPALKINKWKIEKVVDLFAKGTSQPWTPAHFQVASQYPVPLNVSWKLGRETGFNSMRYRDVTGIALR